MKKTFALSTLILSCGLTGVLFVNFGKAPSQKQLVLHKHSHSDRAPSSYTKQRSGLKADVEKVIEGNDDRLLRLRGTVQAHENVTELAVKWNLPADVTVISGDSEFTVTMAAGETKSFEILLDSKTKSDRRVILEVNGLLESGERGSSVAQYFTVEQEALEKRSKVNFLRAKEMVETGELKKIRF